jgi:hypothetical protein
MNLQHDEGQVSNVSMDQRQTRNRVQQAIRKPTYMQYVRKVMAEVDRAHCIKNAEKRGFKIGLEKARIKAEIKWILKLHDGGVPVDIIAQVAHKTVDEVIDILKKHRQNDKAHTV